MDFHILFKKLFFKTLWDEILKNDIFNGAASIAYYLMLSTVPGLIALLSLLPYLPVQNLKETMFELMRETLPYDAASLISRTLEEIMTTPQGELLSFGLFAAVWTASSGVYAIIQQLNNSYHIKESRPYWKVRGLAVLLTLAFGLLITLAFMLIVTGSLIQEGLATQWHWGQLPVTIFATVRWLIITMTLLLGFSLMYFFGPNVKQKFKFITPGAVFGSLGIVAASMGFRTYVSQFGSYATSYGSLGAVIVLMIWLYLSGLVVLVGSEINALIEHHSPESNHRLLQAST